MGGTLNMEVDAGHQNLNSIIVNFGQLELNNANEAETRKKVIDLVLEEVLGWVPIEDIKYEERAGEDGETKFADYILNTASTKVVVEAKRVGVAFDLPTKKRSASLKGVLSQGATGEAIRQARDYARTLSIPFAVVTNGNSWIVFQASRIDGVPWESGHALIFRDLKDLDERFVHFWEVLSRQRVIEGGLESSFRDERVSGDERRIVSTLNDVGFRLGRNRVYEFIEAAVSAALSDEGILKDPEGLSACYVKSSERVKFDSRLKITLADTKPKAVDRKVVRVRSRSNVKHLDNTLERNETEVQQFLLVLGPVGAGKTTFLWYTRWISGREIVDRRSINWLYIDFKKATTYDNPRMFLIQELLDRLEHNETLEYSWEALIEPAYGDYIDKLKSGTLAPLYRSKKEEFTIRIAERIDQERLEGEPFVLKIISYLARKHPTFLVIDNVDQIEDEEYQNKVFIEAQALAQKTGTNTIISLRDSTYLRHRRRPVFNAFQVDTMYIDPPSVIPVLSRRFGYAKRFLKDKRAEITTESGTRIIVSDLSIFLDIVASSVLDSESGYLIDVLSGGDIRRGLTLVREFLASGHTSADKALQAYLSNGRFHFPKHEIFKGILFGQRKFYSEEESLILNVFDAKIGRGIQQLLRLRLLCKLANATTEPGQVGPTYESLREDLHCLGVSSEIVEEVVDCLLDNSLITCDAGADPTNESRIHITRWGAYLLKELCFQFMYLEPCSMDSAIYEDDVWVTMLDLSKEIEGATSNLTRMQLRVNRVGSYIDYLRRLEEMWVVECNRRNLRSGWDDVLMENIAKRSGSETSDILSRVSYQHKVL